MHWEGSREGEIAHELDISQPTVSKIKGKALQRLKGWLKGLF